MTKCLALSISLCLLVLFHGCLASRQQQQQQNECQLNRLQAREPDNRVQSEAGQIESWNYNDDDFQCAGVAAVRVTIEQNGLHLPSYTNAPQLIYVVQGKGVLGTVFPGCPETFEEPQQSEDQEQSYQQTRDRRQGQQEQDRRQGQQQQDRQQRQQEQDRRQRQQEQDRRQRQQGQQQQEGQQQFEQLDRHQKIRRIKEGDLIAIPAGVAYWSYNEGDQELVSVALLDTSNDQNQLDRNPRRFYLAGNPQDEFEQQQQGRQGSRQQHQREQQRDQDRQRQQDRRQRQQQGNSNNMFAGFDTNLLAEALNVDSETARQLQGQNDQNRNQIVRVKGRLDFVHPPRSRDPEQEQQQQEREQREREQRRQQGGRQQGQQESRGSRDNGLEETFCNLRLKENIGRPSSADVFTPQAGRISYLNSNNLPILRYLGLSAERGFLYNNAIYSPHWNLVAHEVFYVIRGNARVQVVNHQGEAILDDEVREGQLFIVPHNHAVLHKAGNQGFEYVAFKTEDNAVINTLAGRTSVLRALPDEVITNAYQVDREQARMLKYNRQETTALSSSQQSDRSRRAIA